MPRDPDPAFLGRTIAGKFFIEAVIGVGAMGAVYRARQIALEKPVAIKVMHSELSSDPTYVARFLREAKAASRIDHPSSVRVIDFGEEPDGLLYLAMELLDGRDLYTVLKNEGPLPALRVGEILSQVLAAVAVAHEMGVVHRDIKPENIMIQEGTDDEGRPRDLVKVCDFGVAKLTERKDRNGDLPTPVSAPAITTEGLVVGTPEYMSPEQGRGEPLDSRSDLYSIGVILYQMLAGKVPFEAESALGIVLKHVIEEPVLPSLIRPEADHALQAVCIRAMKKKREERYATAREMRAEVRAALESHASFAPNARFVSAADDVAIAVAPTERAPADPRPLHDRTPRVGQVGVADTAVAFDSSAIRAVQKSSPAPARDEVGARAAPAAPRARWGGLVLGGMLIAGAVGAVAFKIHGIQVSADPPSGGTTVAAESAAPIVHVSTLASATGPTPNGPVNPPAAHAVVAAAPHNGKLDAGLHASSRDGESATPLLGPSAVPAATPPTATVDASTSVASVAETTPVPLPSSAASSPPSPGLSASPAPSTSPGAIAPVSAGGPSDKNTAKVKVVAVRALGVPPEVLRSAVPDEKFQRCYRAAFNGRGPKPPASTMTLHIDANQEGRVTSANLAGAPPIPKGAGNCVMKAMMGRQVTRDGAFLVNGDIDLSFSVE